uniref:Uncharacterized protein n=1 Tax=Sinocyclocheilus rhinocerous TaxID=307959 RepID=A0A673ML53_9TELE
MVQYESARNRRQVKSSGSMISADDTTAARRSVPFPRCLLHLHACEDVDRRPIRRARSKSDTPYLTETRLSYTLQTGECGCTLLYLLQSTSKEFQYYHGTCLKTCYYHGTGSLYCVQKQ